MRPIPYPQLVLTSSGGRQITCGWQAGGSHPTGMLSCSFKFHRHNCLTSIQLLPDFAALISFDKLPVSDIAHLSKLSSLFLL